MTNALRTHRCRGALALVAKAAIAAVAAVATPLWAQTAPVTTLPPVEVIGTTPVPGIGLPKSQIPANVQTAKSADIDRSHAVDLTGFMNRQLGSVHINEVQNNRNSPTSTVIAPRATTLQHLT